VESIGDISDSRIRLIRQANTGRPTALNRALRLASGEFYTILDADDLCSPARVELQVAAMRRVPSVAAVFCGHELLLNGQRLAPRCRAKGPADCRRDIEHFTMPGHDPTAMFRMENVRGMVYDESLPYVEAFDYVMRVGEQFPMMVLGETLYTYRVHLESITRRDPQKRMAMVRKAIAMAHMRRRLSVPKFLQSDSPPLKPLRNRDRDNNIAAHFMESVLDLRARGRQSEAIRTAIACSRLHPLDPHYQKALVYSVVPRWFTHILRHPANHG
jgi:glycosyltransferase involved in cell wall biosynthesis